MDLAIIGLARSGKASFFNAVTRGRAQVGAFSAQTEPNIGVAHVPDPRVDALARLYTPKKTTYAEVRWVDYPGGGFGPEGPGARFVAEIAGLDALVHVVRAFADEAVPHPLGTVDPARDIESLDLELTFADLALIERRLGRIDAELRSVKAAERARLDADRALLVRLQGELEAGRAVRAVALDDAARKQLATYQFVTRLPVLLVVNIDEDQLAAAAAIEAEYAARCGGPGVAVAALCAKLEAELALLDAADAAEFRRDLGLPPESPLDRAIRAAYALLGLHSFLTAGEDECRAWPVRRGATAPEAAGRIHSDLERGFIRAEVAAWDELVTAGSIPELKKRGRLRTEGKGYVVQDGDVLNILFNL
ncbi:MAG: redox-regulated ATPase YchF [Chloroflexi bacterium]|nr:redox-regulated ATPase YchF [Chloroflexota bacterium]